MSPAASLFDQIALIVTGLVLVLGALSPQIRGRALSLPMLALLTGAALGPLLGVSQLPGQEQSAILFDLASLARATGLFGSALRLPVWDIVHHWRALVVLIGLIMPLMWLTGSVIA